MSGIGLDRDRFEIVSFWAQPVGTVLICETFRWDYKTGAPTDSEFVRVRVAEGTAHNRMVAEPDTEFPTVPVWQDGWIIPGSYNIIWKEKRHD